MSTFDALWDSLLPIGRDPATGGYRRFCWTPAELECRAWFEATAIERQLRVAADGNGNLFAWWDVSGDGGAWPRGPGEFPGHRAGVAPPG